MLRGNCFVFFLPDLLQRFLGVFHRSGGYTSPKTYPGAGFIDQVDGFVGQEPVGYETSRQRGRRSDGLISDIHLVVVFVAAPDTHQYLYGVVVRGLLHPHRLQPAF